MLPSASAFNLSYEDVWIPILNSKERLHGWWIPSASLQAPFSVIPNEPTQILKTPKVMLYLCGVGRNMGDYNYLARVAAFRQLGFSVLVFDYRGMVEVKEVSPTNRSFMKIAKRLGIICALCVISLPIKS
jgi:predicted alpha/beta hydrolase